MRQQGILFLIIGLLLLTGCRRKTIETESKVNVIESHIEVSVDTAMSSVHELDTAAVITSTHHLSEETGQIEITRDSTGKAVKIRWSRSSDDLCTDTLSKYERSIKDEKSGRKGARAGLDRKEREEKNLETKPPFTWKSFLLPFAVLFLIIIVSVIIVWHGDEEGGEK